MGASQSTRKLTIPNEEIGVIQISNDVVQRITQKMNESPGVRDVGVSMANDLPNKPVMQEGEPPSGYPVYYYPKFTLSALEMQQQKEKELETQSQYWQRRLYNMERNHEKIDRLFEEEYKKAIEQMSPAAHGKKEVDLKNTMIPCTENSNKVLKCYQDHPKEVLKCAQLIREFSDCVDQRRATLIATR